MSQAADTAAVGTCEGCGACCLHMAAPPYVDEELALLRTNLPAVYRDLMAVQATRDLQWRVVGVDEVPCGFFDWVTRKCRHHEHKPDVCQRFEVGGTCCLQTRRDVGDLVSQVC